MDVRRYTTTAMVLHWVIALAIITNVALAWLWPKFLPDEAVRPAIDLHKSVGVTVLGLVAMRLLWRYAHPPPPLPEGYKRWEVRASHIAHGLLYVLMFAMPLTGWIMDSAWKDAAAHPMQWFGLFEWPRIAWIMQMDAGLKKQIHDGFGAAHGLLSWLLIAVFVAHVGGALKHQFLDGEKELERMLPGGRA